MQKMLDLFVERSFKTQLEDCQLALPRPIRQSILSGAFPLPEIEASSPPTFQGTMEELLSQITHTVHMTLDHLDYNGLWPYLKILDQLEDGKTFREIRIDSQNEENGSTCVGMSHALLKNIKEKHGIEGSLAVEKKLYQHPFEHAAVIIECSNGFVMLDPRSNPNDRIFSIPFESTVQYQFFSITASNAGSVTPLMLKFERLDEDHPELAFEYYTNIANGDDIVMKHYVMEACTSFIPISLYNPDGSARKFILVVPNESKIVLKDNNASGKMRTQTITFKSILNGELREKLEAFMAPNYCSSAPKFHLSVDMVCEQIYKFASQEERIKQLFKQTNLDEKF